MHGSRKEFLSISLGFEDDPKETRQKQSIKRAWNRLSSLQRSVICLVLLLGFLSIVYLVPAIRHPEHAPDEEILNAKAASARGRLDPPIVVNEAMKRGNKPAHHIPQKLPEDNQRHDLERIAKKQVDDIVRKMKRPVRVVQPVNEKQALNELPRPQGGGEEAGLLPPDEKGEHLERDENGDVNGKEDDNDKDDSVDGQLNPAEKPANPDSDFNEDAKGISTFNYFDPNRKYTERQLAVVDAFKHAWTGYKRYAWGHDEYHPISRTHSEWFGVGLTIVDSIDTIVLMGLKEQYDEAREWVVKDLTFKKDRDVNLFEITIRVLGGLLASYHLTGEEVFKEKATDLGDRLLPCFNSKSKVPFSDVNLLTGRAHPPKWGPDSSTSEVTTIQLELRDLSRVTKDPKYEKAIEEVSMHVHELPKKDGLVPIFINANTGQFRSTSTITFGARGDSYYEYLLKQWIQTGKTKNVYKEDYVQAMEGMKTHLMRESEPNKLLYIGELLGSRSFSPKMDHLVCFLPGTMALGYKNGLPTDHFDIAKKMVKTCFQMYVKTPTKLSPEIVYFNQARESKDDIIIKPADAHNLMRPETVESLFYMYRFTGDTMYQDWGWTIFQAFLKHSKVADGFTSLHNVKSATNPGYADKLESFFLSETLKYLFLLFDDESSLVPLDKYVFNSEGHPLPIYSS